MLCILTVCAANKCLRKASDASSCTLLCEINLRAVASFVNRFSKATAVY